MYSFGCVHEYVFPVAAKRAAQVTMHKSPRHFILCVSKDGTELYRRQDLVG